MIPELKVTGRVLSLSKSTLARNPNLAGGGESRGRVLAVGNHAEKSASETHTAGLTDQPARPSRIRQSSKPLMNKLETEWFNICKKCYPENCQVLAQALRFRLGNGIWYKPDVIVMAGKVYAYEVKGPYSFRGGFENLKVAAGLYHSIGWTLVWKEDGEWKEQEVFP